MRANIDGIDLQGTPEEIAKYSAEMKRLYNQRYSQDAQRKMFDRQEGEMWREA